MDNTGNYARGALAGGDIGASNQDGGVAQAVRERTTDEVRAEFCTAMEAVMGAYNALMQTTDPEVYSHRAIVLSEAANELGHKGYWLKNHAFNASKK